MCPTPDREPITLTLSGDAALVLDAWLTRLSQTEDAAAEVAPTRAESAALNEFGCALEKSLVAPFHADYARLLAEASDRLLRGTR